jgi:hypothetical protein
LKRSRHQRIAGYQYQIPTWNNGWEQQSHGFAQQSFGAIALDSITHRAACADTHAQAVLGRWNPYQHNKRVREGLALVSHPLEVYGPGQAKTMFHPGLALKDTPRARKLTSLRRGSLPTNPFNVIIDFDRKLGTTAAAPAAQYFTTVSCGHSFAKTMHAGTATNLGLICTFSRHSLLPLHPVIITKIMPLI